ncbi:hypothetical protein [Chamaesiphon polymorphus]|uniref:hypothetical protein n=1 Tax=Chamaesiphon polymorphus TaxID=2107691 RepID=UPI0011B279D3|nr:hypothetical protein [Chamaesiphon polymorphus]
MSCRTKPGGNLQSARRKSLLVMQSPRRRTKIFRLIEKYCHRAQLPTPNSQLPTPNSQLP